MFRPDPDYPSRGYRLANERIAEMEPSCLCIRCRSRERFVTFVHRFQHPTIWVTLIVGDTTSKMHFAIVLHGMDRGMASNFHLKHGACILCPSFQVTHRD